MSLFVKQDETRTRLQQQIAAELQEKAKKRAEEAERPDGVDDSRYIENTSQTTRRAWIWAIVFVVILAIAIFIIVKGVSR